ncbi:nitrous oxide reductase accessory protein NosL [Suttonella ornithocola]|uniref:NosL n=1 Tax=Suttonella ornithocola TaxID=279832 RepID=A0A380MPE7_9GAMM|nr:nitrous oxide reductase accessory protein NosL [Suttonella ornithocola]SUO94489.1 NosL [Suttonella ornithocola]
MTKPLLIILFLCLSACDSAEKTATPQAPQMLIPEDAKDYYSHMGVLENSGEKGQVLLLDGQRETLWFGSVKNLLTYLHHPETANRPMQAYVGLLQK